MDDYKAKLDSALSYSKAIKYLTDLLVQDDLLKNDDSLFYVVCLGLLDRLMYLLESKLDDLVLFHSHSCTEDNDIEIAVFERLHDKLADILEFIDTQLRD